jgi:hypothetical protein
MAYGCIGTAVLGKNVTGPSMPPVAVIANSTERVRSRNESCP